MAEKLLTIREVSALLGMTEKEVIDLAEEGKVPAYKVGGVYLRFKREQVEEYRRAFRKSKLPRSGFGETVADFFYFNDFYILSALIIAGLVYIVVFT